MASISVFKSEMNIVDFKVRLRPVGFVIGIVNHCSIRLFQMGEFCFLTFICVSLLLRTH